MNVLIVENRRELASVWQRHIERQGHRVLTARSQTAAIHVIQTFKPDMIVLNLVLSDGSALAISDFASFRLPETKVIFVTDTTFFSDGSLFAYAGNACAHVQAGTPPEDLAAMIDYYAASA